MILLYDIRYAFRIFAKAPGVSFLAIVALALGIGPTTAIFSIVHAVLLRSLPFRDPDRIVKISESRQRGNAGVRSDEYVQWREHSRTLESLAMYMPCTNAVISGGADPEPVGCGNVDPAFFDALGVQAALGRTFVRGEENDFTSKVILSNGLWKRRFGGDPDIVGKGLEIGSSNRVVIGVLPPGFEFPEFRQIDVWMPFKFVKDGVSFRDPVIARLKPGVTAEQSQAELAVMSAALDAERNPIDRGFRPVVTPIHEVLTGWIRPTLLLLLAAVGFVLLIACANVAHLALARSSARRKEIAIRAAIGAGRARLVRQMITESLTLAGMGGAAGLILALWLIDLVRSIMPKYNNVPGLSSFGIDLPVLAFTAVAVMGTGILTGLAPALQIWKADVNDVLKQSESAANRVGSRKIFQSFLVASEIATASVLMAGAILMVRTLIELNAVNPGFNPSGVLTTETVGLPPPYQGDKVDRAVPVFNQALQKLRMTPGVLSASATDALPMGGVWWRGHAQLDQRPADLNYSPQFVGRSVFPGFFQTMGVTRKSGRDFSDTDTRDSQPVVIVNERAARKFWPGENPLGKKLRLAVRWLKNDEREVVGVVSDVLFMNLNLAPEPEVYVPFAQAPASGAFVVVRAASPSAFAPVFRAQMRTIIPDKRSPPPEVRSMQSWIDDRLRYQRFVMILLIAFTVIAVGLAASGVYGVTSYAVAQRTREIGIRMALGAEARDVTRMILGRGIAVALAGAAAGIAGAYALSRYIATLLYGVKSTDGAVYAAAGAALVAVAVAACYLPARRATRIDPILALRNE